MVGRRGVGVKRGDILGGITGDRGGDRGESSVVVVANGSAGHV